MEKVNDLMCTNLISGLTELLALTSIMIPLIFMMTLMGVRVVQRYKIDVPKTVVKPKQEGVHSEGETEKNK